MPKTSNDPAPNPAVLQFQGRHLEAAAAIQMRNIDEFRRMANQICDDAEALIKQQAELLAVDANANISSQSIGLDLVDMPDRRERHDSHCNKYVEVPVEQMVDWADNRSIQSSRLHPIAQYTEH